MKRRVFLKGMSLMAMSTLFPTPSSAASIDLSKVNFDSNVYRDNEAQIIMIFLYGGASELAGNLTNFEDIQKRSENHYESQLVTPTVNSFWQQAGGESMERMLNNEDMNIFRTCYRKAVNSRSHGVCVSENQRGVVNPTNPHATPGIFSVLGKVLANNGVIDSGVALPFVTLGGETGFFSSGDINNDINLDAFLRPVTIGESLENPYKRGIVHAVLHTNEEWNSDPRVEEPAALQRLDALAKRMSSYQKIQDSFDRRRELSIFIEKIKRRPIPEGIKYPDNNEYADQFKTAVKILVGNPETKVISLGGRSLGNWDDHSYALSYYGYTRRMKRLMKSIEVAMEHIKAEGKDNISIIVFSEFGRNVNLNSSKGWDHGNNQNVYIFGGKRYFNHLGIVGETELEPYKEDRRLYLRPTENSYWFEPYSVASTIYKMCGITNPEVLCSGHGAIEAGLFK